MEKDTLKSNLLKKTDHEFEVNMVKLTVQGLMGAATYRH